MGSTFFSPPPAGWLYLSLPLPSLSTHSILLGFISISVPFMLLNPTLHVLTVIFLEHLRLPSNLCVWVFPSLVISLLIPFQRQFKTLLDVPKILSDTEHTAVDTTTLVERTRRQGFTEVQKEATSWNKNDRNDNEICVPATIYYRKI